MTFYVYSRVIRLVRYLLYSRHSCIYIYSFIILYTTYLCPYSIGPVYRDRLCGNQSLIDLMYFLVDLKHFLKTQILLHLVFSSNNKFC
jgi:hypothetical protein